MAEDGTTRWSLIRAAAEGAADERTAFAEHYEPVVRAFLGTRWRTHVLVESVDDACQEVFVDCFREKGALARAAPDRPGGFRAFLHGVTRNVALRFEERRLKQLRREGSAPEGALDGMQTDDAQAQAFDRAWAVALVQQAGRLHARRAESEGRDAVRRVELLRRRFGRDEKIKDIASSWHEDPAKVHRAYARARREFHTALRDVVKDHLTGDAPSIDAECDRVLDALR